MLLILEQEYTNHQSFLAGVTDGHEAISMSGMSWVYCEVTNQSQFDLYKSSLNAENYSDGILLPPKAVGKG